jgi:hypothetical protein
MAIDAWLSLKPAVVNVEFVLKKKCKKSRVAKTINVENNKGLINFICLSIA